MIKLEDKDDEFVFSDDSLVQFYFCVIYRLILDIIIILPFYEDNRDVLSQYGAKFKRLMTHCT